MVTAGFSRLKCRTVTCEDELGPKPSPGKFTLTPSSLVPPPDLSLQMAEESGMLSEGINVILHVFTLGNLKVIECFSHTKTVTWKPKKSLAHIGALHDKSMNRWRILHTKQTTASPWRLLAWNSWLMRGNRFGWAWVHRETQERRSVFKQMVNFQWC